MAEYILEVKGKHTLQEIELVIEAEEAAAAEFLGSSLSYYNGAITNLLTFNELPAGTIPVGSVSLVKHGNAPPSGKTSVWAGVMLVKGSNTAVAAYR